MLTAVQQDALKEYMNIFIGEAASLLSEMVNQKINLSIPEIQLVSLSDNKGEAFHSMPSFLKSHVVSSSIKFGTHFSGKADLVFPMDRSKLLVNLCMGEEEFMGEEDEQASLTDTDFDAIREVGNIILNAVVGGLGNLMKVKLDYHLPEVEVLYFPDTENDLLRQEGNYLLVIHNAFSVAQFQVDGAILVILSMGSINYLLNKIDQIVQEIEE